MEAETDTQTLQMLFDEVARDYPYPIAAAVRSLLDAPATNPWSEWEQLCRDVLGSALRYLAHLLLSDLVATGRQPAHLFHRIHAILGRPMAGHYVGFLREAARYYRDEGLQCAVPELLAFLKASELDPSLTDNGEPLLGLLVDYRNLWAHGRMVDESAEREHVERIRTLVALLLDRIRFLTEYPLELTDGGRLMGSTPVALDKKAQPLVVIAAGGVALRPLLLKLDGRDLVLLEDFDEGARRITYRGTATYKRFTKRQLGKGEGAQIFDELRSLLERVRAIDAVVPRPNWSTFEKRVSVVTEETLSLYEDMRKYKPEWFVPRPEWAGEGNLFDRFLDSDRTLLVMSGVQGTGKSALVSHLAARCRKDGHAVLLVNAQRFTYLDVKASENPYSRYFADLLHYSEPFSSDSFRRIAKTAEPGKKVVVFIDAINEVQGIDSRWNRFRAMELMLQWLVDIAVPGLKVVLSFRLDAYEEYEYLQPDELPEGLDGIAWPGTHERKPWITEIVPFDKVQAEALYEKLRAQPKYGMAPDMTWVELSNRLVDSLEDVTANPLLFQVFLRAHHGLEAVVVTDRAKLFERYAARITGALELSRRPWWRRVLGFIRNGNITPKERFLADAVERMGKEGGASFLVEDLRKKPDKRDRRLLARLDDPTDRTEVELEEASLLATERIEIDAGDGNEESVEVSRRIAPVGEVLVHAMAGVAEKLRRIETFRVTVGMFLLMCFGVPLVLSAAGWLMLGQALARFGITPQSGQVFDTAQQLAWSTQGFMVLTISAWFGLAFLAVAINIMAPDSGALIGPRQLGLTRYGHHRRVRSGMSFLPIPVLLSTIPVFGFPFFGIVSDLNDDLSFAPGYGLVVALAILLSPMVMMRLERISNRGSPVRLVLSYHRKFLSVVESDRHRRMDRSRFLFAAVSAVIAAVGAVWLCELELHLPMIPIARSSPELSLSSIRLAFHGISSRDLADILVWFLPSFILVVFGVGFATYIPWIERRTARSLLKDPTIRPVGNLRSKAIAYFVGCEFLATVFVACALYLIPKNSLDPDSLLSTLGISSSEATFDDDGFLTDLDLLGAELDAATLEMVYEQQRLRVLTLPRKTNLIFDLDRFAELEELNASLDQLLNLDRTGALMELTLYDDAGFDSTRVVDRPIGRVTVEASFSDTENLARVFPRLRSLIVREAFGEVRLGDMQSGFWQDLQLGVESEGPPRLDWLRPSHLRYIIRLEQAIGPDTANTELLTRLWMPADGLEPSLVAQCDQLQWLKLYIEEPRTAEWYAALREVVATSLPNLVTLELLTKEEGSSLQVARGRDEALELLDRLIANPTLLGHTAAE